MRSLFCNIRKEYLHHTISFIVHTSRGVSEGGGEYFVLIRYSCVLFTFSFLGQLKIFKFIQHTPEKKKKREKMTTTPQQVETHPECARCRKPIVLSTCATPRYITVEGSKYPAHPRCYRNWLKEQRNLRERENDEEEENDEEA